MRQIIAGFDMSPTVAPSEVHPSHWMKNDSEFFVWPVCQHCNLNAIHDGYLLTKECGAYTEEDVYELLRRRNSLTQ
jgi:hypothetical protein